MRFVLLLIITGLAAFAHAETDSSASCSGNVLVPGNFISGTCSNGFCNAFLPSDFLNVDGNCSDGSSFRASALAQGQSVSGQCRNGFFTAFIPADYVNWNGQCSNGGSFSATSML